MFLHILFPIVSAKAHIFSTHQGKLLSQLGIKEQIHEWMKLLGRWKCSVDVPQGKSPRAMIFLLSSRATKDNVDWLLVSVHQKLEPGQSLEMRKGTIQQIAPQSYMHGREQPTCLAALRFYFWLFQWHLCFSFISLHIYHCITHTYSVFTLLIVLYKIQLLAIKSFATGLSKRQYNIV